MTPEELTAMDAKATAGPWKASPYPGTIGSQVWTGEPGDSAILICGDGDAEDTDAALIVALRNAVPEIIAALSAQARRIAELEGETARLREALQDAADFAEIRIKDGIEIGAVVWRMALENIRADVCAELKGGRDADR